MTALAVLRLVEQGKADLDTVGAYPGYAVTLRQLLSHTAGVSPEGFDGYSRGSPLPTIAQILAGEPPANSPPIVIENAPGTQYRYSGGGYVLVQEIIEAASGEAFANAMAKLVLLPLGMTDSSFEQPLPEALASNAAAGHDVRSRPLEGKWRTYPEARVRAGSGRPRRISFVSRSRFRRPTMGSTRPSSARRRRATC